MIDSITVENHHQLSKNRLFSLQNPIQSSKTFSKLTVDNPLQKITIAKIFFKQKEQQSSPVNAYLNIYKNNPACLNSDWTSLSVICFGVCELSIRSAFAKHPYTSSFDRD